MNVLDRRLANAFLIYLLMKVIFALILFLFPLGQGISRPTVLILAADLIMACIVLWFQLHRSFPKRLLRTLMFLGYGLLVAGQINQIVNLSDQNPDLPYQMVRSLYGYYVYFITLTVLLAWVSHPRLLVGGILGWHAWLVGMVVLRTGSLDLVTILIIFSQSGSALVIGLIVNFLVRQQQGEERLLRRKAILQEELAVSWERNRMARELHDTLAHSLSAIAVQLEASRTLLDRDPARGKELLELAHGLALDGLQDTRYALQSLRATPLQDQGLCLALRGLAQDAARRSGATLELDLPDSPPADLASEVEHSMYRIAQEALENIVRHSGAHRIQLQLELDSDRISLTIADDGVGFDPGQVHQSRYGLVGLRERAELLGATLTITSKPGEGCTISFTRKENP